MNVEELDLSENRININDLSSLPMLRSLKLRSSLIEHISIDGTSNAFATLQNLDLAFNKLVPTEITNLFHLEHLKCPQ